MYSFALTILSSIFFAYVETSARPASGCKSQADAGRPRLLCRVRSLRIVPHFLGRGLGFLESHPIDNSHPVAFYDKQGILRIY